MEDVVEHKHIKTDLLDGTAHSARAMLGPLGQPVVPLPDTSVQASSSLVGCQFRLFAKNTMLRTASHVDFEAHVLSLNVLRAELEHGPQKPQSYL